MIVAGLVSCRVFLAYVSQLFVAAFTHGCFFRIAPMVLDLTARGPVLCELRKIGFASVVSDFFLAEECRLFCVAFGLSELKNV